MKSLRTWITFLTAIVAMSLAGLANSAQPTKQWSITVLPSLFSTTTNVDATITIKNETPNGNSTINSLKLFLPTGYTVNSVTNTYQAMVDITQSGVIAFSNMSPLKPQASFTFHASLNVNTSQAGCAQTTWASSMAWTGSSFSGDTFQLTFSTATRVDPNNQLAFQSVTPSVPVGTDITGSVKATSCGGAPSPAVSVKVDLINSSNAVVGTNTTSTNGNGVVSIDFPTTTLTAGSYTVKASVPADASYAAITTPVTVCGNALSFTGQPFNIKSGDPTSATVHADSCGSAGAGVSVTAQLKDSSNQPVGSPQALSTNTSGNVTFSFTPTALGTYTIAATATNYTGATSNAFKVFAGILACGDPIAASFIDPTNLAPDQPGYGSGTRSSYNKDGVAEQCVPVLYTFTNTILTNETVNLTWDTSSQPNAAFEYTLNWQAQPVEAGDTVSGWPMELRPVVAWLNADGSESTGLSANPKFVPALACLGNTLPKPYGTLVNAVDDQPGTVSITVTGIASNPSINNPQTGTPYTKPVPGDPALPAYPFPIVIADMVGGSQATATERMLVTGDTVRSQSGGIWTMTFTVQRGDGMTTRAAHDAGYRVMSTPLPLIPTDDPTNFPATVLPPGVVVYVPGTQAHMCVAAHGFTSFDFSGGTAHLLYKTHVFDIGDGWVGLR
jgi:hypothetical protein